MPVTTRSPESSNSSSNSGHSASPADSPDQEGKSTVGRLPSPGLSQDGEIYLTLSSAERALVEQGAPDSIAADDGSAYQVRYILLVRGPVAPAAQQRTPQPRLVSDLREFLDFRAAGAQAGALSSTTSSDTAAGLTCQ